MSIATYIFLLPLIGAFLVLLIPGNYRFVIRNVALLTTLLSLIAAVVMFCQFYHNPGEGFQFVQQTQWAPALGISFHVGVDGMNAGLLLMGAAVIFAAVCVSRQIKTREKEFYFLLLTMGGGVLGAFASLDLFFFYFFHELALIPTFIMIGVWGYGAKKNLATFQITLYLSVGALLALIGLIALYLQVPAPHRTFDLVELTNYFHAHPMPAAPQKIIFPLLLFGFGILVSLWPFHTWAPLGYGSAPTGTAMIHAGVLKKFGLYGLIRIAMPLLPNAMQDWAGVLSVLCLGNILYCGLVAMRQRDLNMLIGNSSVAHMGFAFLGIASLHLIGVTGTVLIMVAHGFLAALTYALSGYLRDELQTTDMDQMGGLLRKLPFVGTVMIIAMMAGCGLPGFANFPGELLTMFGSWERSPLISGIAIWGALVIAGVYMLRAIRDILHGEKQYASIKDVTQLWQRMPYALLVGGLLVFGCFPRLLTDNIRTSVAPIIRAVGGEVLELAPVPKGHSAK